MKSRLVIACVLIAATALIYAGQLSGPFVFDDEQAIVTNSSIRSLWPIGPVLRPPRDTPVAGRPIPNLSLAINYAVSGLNPFGFHVVNLGLHCLAGLLLFGALRRILASPLSPQWLQRQALGLAGVSALLWCVHPVAVEVVLYATQRTEACATVCYLLTIYAAIRVIQMGNAIGHGVTNGRVTSGAPAGGKAATTKTGWTLTAVFACALGMGSKATMVTAPVVVLLMDRAFFGGSFAEALRRRGPLYAALASTWALLMVLQLDSPRPRSVAMADPAYLAAQSRLLFEYLGLAFWPQRLVGDYGPLFSGQDAMTQNPALWLTGSAALLLVGVSGVSVFTHPRCGFVGAWFFGILAPSSSLVTIHTEVGADRRLYLPLAALIALVVIVVYGSLQRVCERFAAPRRSRIAAVGPAVALALLSAVALGARSRARTEDFQTTLGFWQSAVQARPSNSRAHYNLAETHRRQGNLKKAIEAYKAATALREDYTEAEANLGAALIAAGQMQPGLAHLQRALELNPDSAAARYNLGLALGMAGRFSDAVPELKAVLALEPAHIEARLRLALALAKTARFGEARHHLQTILEEKPDHAGAIALMRHIRASTGAKHARKTAD